MSARTRVATALAFAVVAAASGTARAEDRRADPDSNHVYSAKAMGTRVTVTLRTDDEQRAAKASSAVFEEFERVDRLMTSWLEDSDVSKINAAAGERAVVVDEEVFAVIERAIDMARKTGGAFDITVGAFRGLWKFDQDRDGTIPDPADVKKRLRLVGWKGVILNKRNKSVKLRRKGMRITLGGIAKGYAVDRAVRLLWNRGFTSFILQAGGDLYVSGTKGARKWVVGIRDPRGAKVNDPFAVAEIEDRTFSTSGDYERTVVIDGKRYHHILDPKTGFPVTGIRSVTVMAKDAITADAWSTALFVLGADAGMKLVEKSDDLEAVFVDGDNAVHVSSGLRGKVHMLKKPSPGI